MLMTRVPRKATWVHTVIMTLHHSKNPFIRMVPIPVAPRLNLEASPRMASVRAMEIMKVR
jgi:hypothetical protein